MIQSYTRPLEGIAEYSRWWVGASEDETKMYEVRCCRMHGKRFIAFLEGVEDRNLAEQMRGYFIWVDAADVPLEEGEYLWADLVGCRVYDLEGERELGEVVRLESYGAQDNLCVVSKHGEWLIPFIEDVIVKVDIEGRRIDVRLLEGMEACFKPRS